jgi:hypothetical protein
VGWKDGAQDRRGHGCGAPGKRLLSGDKWLF